MSSEPDWCSPFIHALASNKEDSCPQCAAIVTEDPYRLTELAAHTVVIPLHSESLLGASLSTQDDYYLFFYALLAAFYDVIQTPLLTKYTATHHDNLKPLPDLEIFAKLVYHKNTELNIRFWDAFHAILDGLKSSETPKNVEDMLWRKIEEVGNIVMTKHKLASDAPLIIAIADGDKLKEETSLWEHLPKILSYVVAINPKDTIASLLNADSTMCMKAVTKVPKLTCSYKYEQNVTSISGMPGWAPAHFSWMFYVAWDAPYPIVPNLQKLEWYMIPEIDGHERWNLSFRRLIYSLLLDVTFLADRHLPLSSIFPERIHESAYKTARKNDYAVLEFEICANAFAAHRSQILALVADDYGKLIVHPEADQLLGALFLLSFHFKDDVRPPPDKRYSAWDVISQPVLFKTLMRKVMGRCVERELGAEIANSYISFNTIRKTSSRCRHDSWSNKNVPYRCGEDLYFDFEIPLVKSRLGPEPVKAESNRMTCAWVKIISDADAGPEAFLEDLCQFIRNSHYAASICLIFLLRPNLTDYPAISTIDNGSGGVRVFICSLPEIYARLNFTSEEIASAEKLLSQNDI